MLIVCGDDSSDDKLEKVLAVGGLAGTPSQWTSFKEAWKRQNAVAFHSSDCESDRREFARFNHKDNLALYRANVTLIVESGLCGFASAIDIRSLRRAVPGLPRDYGFYLCFADFCSQAAKLGALLYPKLRVDTRFDRNTERNHAVGILYEYLRDQYGLADVLCDRVTVSCRHESIEVQAADVIARELMKDFDNELAHADRPKRKSFLALDASKKFRWARLDSTWIDTHVRGSTNGRRSRPK